MNKHLISNTKTLVNNSKTAFEVVYYGVNHTHNGQLAQFVSDEGVNTIKQFLKTNFDYCGELSVAKREAIKQLQTKLIKYMNKQTKPVAKKKKVVAKKKAVAKKKTAKVSLKDKYTKLYKIVSNYSDNLMQDVYSVVYRTKELKRFINTNLANKFIEQEVLVKIGEHSMKESKKTKLLKAELQQEFA